MLFQDYQNFANLSQIMNVSTSEAVSILLNIAESYIEGLEQVSLGDNGSKQG